MLSRTQKALKGFATDVIQFSVLILLQIILAPLVLKVAGQEVLGAYSIIMQVIGYGLIIDFGLSVSISRYLSRNFDARNDGAKFTNVFNVSRYFVLVTNTLLSVFIIMLAIFADELFKGSQKIIGEIRICLYFFAIWSVIKTPFILYTHSLRASQNMSVANIIGLFSGACRLILSLYLVYSGFGLIGLIIANILSEFFGLLLNRICFNRLYPNYDMCWYFPDRKLLREIFFFGLTYWGVNIAIVLTVGSDSIIIGNLYGAAAVAIFYTTKLPVFLGIQIIYKISDNSGAAVNQLVFQKNFELVRVAYLNILRYSLLLALPLAVGTITFNEAIITLWVGPNQYAGDLMTIALASFVLTQTINHINAMITVAVGRMKHWITLSILIGFCTIISSYFLGKTIGIQMVMVSIAVMDIPGLIFLFYRSFSGIGMTLPVVYKSVLLPVMLASMPLLLWSCFVIFMENEDTLIVLLKNIAFFIFFWLVGLYLFGINKAERVKLTQRIVSLNL